MTTQTPAPRRPSFPAPLLQMCCALVAAALRPRGDVAFPVLAEAAARSHGSAFAPALRWVATVHGVAPLLHWRLEQADTLAALDPSLQGFLAQQRAHNGTRVAAIQAELAEILASAQVAGIPLLPLKGAVLTQSYYPHPALRPMADLDLLVRPADESAALALLATLGYQQINRTDRHRVLALPRNNGPVVDFGGEHPDNPRSVELHTAVAETFWGIGWDATEALWLGCSPKDAWSAPAALLRHLLLHVTTEIMARKLRLIHLYDLTLVQARLIPSDWDDLLREARARREGRMLFPALLLQQRTVGGVPEHVLASLATDLPPSLMRYLADADLCTLSHCTRTPVTLRARLSWHRPGREYLVALRYALLPSPAELRAFYPSATTPLSLPLAYGRYALLAASWPLRRIMGLPRHGAAEHRGAGD